MNESVICEQDVAMDAAERAVPLDPRRLFGFRLAVNDETASGPQTGLKMGTKDGGKLFGGNAGIRKKRI
jgi:hypothetical protein